ncbi:unnamed protein product, partial [Owenia fusiformis]
TDILQCDVTQTKGTSTKYGFVKSQKKRPSILDCGRKNKTHPSIQTEEERQENKWLMWVEKQFNDIAGEDGEIDLEEFKAALKIKRSFFAERFFNLFDEDDSGTIDISELMCGLDKLINGTATDKLKFLFDVYDVDGSGTIELGELKTVLRSCMEESSITLSEDDLTELTKALFHSADEDNSGEISFDELKVELEKHPGVLENLTMSAANWLRPPEIKTAKPKYAPRYLTQSYIMNNKRKVGFVAFYILINIALFLVSAIRYRAENWFVIIARGSGMDLNFNCMFVLVLMLRKCLTWLRSTTLAQFLPLDQSIMFHKMVGIVIAVQSLVHTVCHLGNLALVVANVNSFTYMEYLFTTKPAIGWIAGLAPLSGVALDLVLIIMLICSMPFVRRGGHFQVFYWTHLLYVIFWALLVIHGPIFCYWFALPGVIFIIEKISSSKFVKLAHYGETYIKEVNLLPSKVTHLIISRPDNFRFKAGDYIFINIPALAEYEWHPFTISSAPELRSEIWVHVRSVGHWTGKLNEFFEKYEDYEHARIQKKNTKVRHCCCPIYTSDGGHSKDGKCADAIDNKFEIPVITIAGEKHKDRKHTSSSNPKQEEHIVNRNEEVANSKLTNVKIYIDGPYGTATREIFESDHAVLIGAGIGVTPFASILQSIMHRHKPARLKCPNCSHTWFNDTATSTMNLKKVDFVWINREQKSFEWFVSLLTKLELEQAEGGSFGNFLDMHMYMTSALKKTDMKGIGLQMALEIIHKKEKRDMLTGLKTRTQAGRPNWEELFSKISQENKGKVKVFFCGSPALAKTLKQICQKFKFDFLKENF